MTMGYDSTGGVYPGHYYGGGGGGCEDSRQHGWGGAYHHHHQQVVAHPQGSPSQRYPYYDTRYR